ncbi:MAG: helix-hairpin-helix domain-containing protein [Betaproteobacteria bacterium]|nr:helix-hairpin-helix domain-containing protein [Betaproteobacteria bacterium]
MQRNITHSALIAVALLLSANLSFAADNKPGTAAETKAISAPKATEKAAKAKDAKAAAKVKLVDINSAGKKDLMTLPGINDAEADKIIAGRPYGSKAHLVTHNILARGVYENLKTLVIAKQKPEPAAKPGQK